MVRYLIDNHVISNYFSGVFSDLMVDECIAIRRNCKMKTPDAIIAATAIINDFTLLTSDADFNHISNLKILNPFKNDIKSSLE